MELVKFRIKNYKSIVDSGDCYFSDKLTILAGKNESGKTSVLEALEDFHVSKTIRDEAKPIDSDGVPEIILTFKLTKDEINELLAEVNIDSSIDNDITLVVSKKHGNNLYALDLEARKSLNLTNIYNETKKLLLETLKTLDDFFKKNPSVAKPKLDNKKLKDYKNELVAIKDQAQGIAEISDEDKEQIKGCIEKAGEIIDAFYARELEAKKFIDEFVKSKLPYFILFSSFKHEFPSSIELAALPADEWAKDLEQVSSFNIKKITSTSDQERRNHQESVNTEFTDKFKKFWTQDKIKLQVEKEGQKINFWIVENGKQFYPAQRSKGQQWYLSFYIKIVARLNEDKPNVILIDEPGLYLHAKAQKDLLAVLLEHGSSYPVIFSTHSPYLINEENLENIRLIEKSATGTKVLGKIHAHSTADKETLTPILTAIGLGINDSITNLDQKNNIVVEGPEDVFYLQAFKKLHDENLTVNFVNGGGAPNMGVVGSILEGWGANVFYLYDNDKGKKDGEKNLKQAWKVKAEVIKAVLAEEGKGIADILSVDDFKKFVLDNADLKYTSSNSEYLKKQKSDKVLLARKFLQKVKSQAVELDDTSRKNISNLFAEIDFTKNEK